MKRVLIASAGFGMALAIGIDTTSADTMFSFETRWEEGATTFEECLESVEADHVPPEPPPQIEMPESDGDLEPALNAMREVALYMEVVERNLKPFIETWSVLAEPDAEGRWALKPDTVEDLGQRGAAAIDCTIRGAQKFHDALIEPEFKAAQNAGLLIAAGAVDFFKEMYSNAESQQRESQFRFLLEESEKVLVHFEELQLQLSAEMLQLRENIALLKEERQIFVWLYKADRAQKAKERLIMIVQYVQTANSRLEKLIGSAASAALGTNAAR